VEVSFTLSMASASVSKCRRPSRGSCQGSSHRRSGHPQAGALLRL